MRQLAVLTIALWGCGGSLVLSPVLLSDAGQPAPGPAAGDAGVIADAGVAADAGVVVSGQDAGVPAPHDARRRRQLLQVGERPVDRDELERGRPGLDEQGQLIRPDAPDRAARARFGWLTKRYSSRPVCSNCAQHFHNQFPLFLDLG